MMRDVGNRTAETATESPIYVTEMNFVLCEVYRKMGHGIKGQGKGFRNKHKSRF